ncbi:MAG: nucleotidyl transferase AbiEii/AbiGii toxin family protein, partial [Phycisphaerales bacterium]|nr:nucleotidyl transferase AbiEii/AbiGii toxin family protein [Phycisphaerales bacterium]
PAVSRISRGTPEADAYLDLKNRAQREKRPTQELLQLYVLEAFLIRLTASDLRDRFVLKGGVLLAAFDERRPTRDVDLAGLDLANDAVTVLDLVRSIVEASPPLEDGVVFLPEAATSEVIREEDAYSGVRVSMGARLASANLPFHVDVNVGDPIWPAPKHGRGPAPAWRRTDRAGGLSDPHGARREDRDRDPARCRQHAVARLRRHLDALAAALRLGVRPARGDRRRRGSPECSAVASR